MYPTIFMGIILIQKESPSASKDKRTFKNLNDDNYDLTLIKDLNKLVNLLKENISKWSETVVQEKIENLKDGLEPENHEIN